MGWQVAAFIVLFGWSVVEFALLFLMSVMVVMANKREVSLKEANRALAEQIVAARQQLGEARVPVNLQMSDAQILQMALAINNVRESMNLPPGQVQ